MAKSKSSKSPSKKSSSSKKGSPKKSPKEKQKKTEGADTSDAESLYPLDKPERLPPPPDPSKGPILSQMIRQLWMPYATTPIIECEEPFWSPCFPLITSWGDIWLSDPAYRCIRRYMLDPISAKVFALPPLLVTKGEPNMIAELSRSGQIAALLRCPKAKKTSLVVYNPKEMTELRRIDFKCEVLKEPLAESIKPSPSNSKSSNEPTDEVAYLEDDSTPIGLCSNRDILFVLFHPMQKMQVFNPLNLHPYELRLENAFPDESTCVHLASSGGCVANEDQLFVAATRPPRVQVFWVNRQSFLEKIDRIEVTWYAEFGIDRLAVGEPFGLQLDSCGLLVVSDSRFGELRVYNPNHRRQGPYNPSLPHGETCYMGSWKIDAYQTCRPGYFSLSKFGVMCLMDRWSNRLLIFADQTGLRWLDDTFLYLDEIPYLRPVVDPMMPVAGLPAPPVLEALGPGMLKKRSSTVSLLLPDDELLTDDLKLRYHYQPPGQDPNETAGKKKSPNKKSPRGSKSKSPKSKSPKSKSSKK